MRLLDGWDTELHGIGTQAGRNGTDILFTPSMTFRETDPTFTDMAIIRAIESGVSVVHVSDDGLSVITDPLRPDPRRDRSLPGR